jgi:hypothetical protein
MPHRYRISVTPLVDSPDPAAGPTYPRSLSFEVTNHDDLMAVLRRVSGAAVLPQEEAAEFVVGLKLFGEVLLRHRKDPLFAELMPHFGAFMKQLKSHAKGDPATA